MTDDSKIKERKEKLKKFLVFSLMGLTCAGFLWWIFLPSEKDSDMIQIGLNTTIPDPKENELMGNKKTAYERDHLSKNGDERMFSLEEYISKTETILPQPEQPEEIPAKPSSGIESSVEAFKGIQNSLENVYEPARTHEQDQEILDLIWRVQELEREKNEESKEKKYMEQQVEMLEKSYELHAKYIQQNPEGTPVKEVTGNNTSSSSQTSPKKIFPVDSYGGTLVSTLSDPLDKTGIYTNSPAVNSGFHTVSLSNAPIQKNTIAACINKDQTLTSGQVISLRLLEPVKINGIVIPANTLFSGIAKIQSERMEIKVDVIEYRGAIFPVNLTVCDTDGVKGLYVPGSEEIDAAKEILANMGSSLGTSITITDNVGSQMAADATKSLIQGTSKYFQKKVRAVKVNVKVGYRLYLYSE